MLLEPTHPLDALATQLAQTMKIESPVLLHLANAAQFLDTVTKSITTDEWGGYSSTMLPQDMDRKLELMNDELRLARYEMTKRRRDCFTRQPNPCCPVRIVSKYQTGELPTVAATGKPITPGEIDAKTRD